MVQKGSKLWGVEVGVRGGGVGVETMFPYKLKISDLFLKCEKYFLLYLN